MALGCVFALFFFFFFFFSPKPSSGVDHTLGVKGRCMARCPAVQVTDCEQGTPQGMHDAVARRAGSPGVVVVKPLQGLRHARRSGCAQCKPDAFLQEGAQVFLSPRNSYHTAWRYA